MSAEVNGVPLLAVTVVVDCVAVTPVSLCCAKTKFPGTYEVETIDQQGIALISTIQVGVNASGSLIKIFVIGDSTVANYTATQYPWAGWGQELNLFFDASKIVVNNRAKGGRSSRTYYQEGSWATVKAELEPRPDLAGRSASWCISIPLSTLKSLRSALAAGCLISRIVLTFSMI